MSLIGKQIKSIYFVNVPHIKNSSPPLACAILQSIALEQHIETNYIDLNLEHNDNYLKQFKGYDCVALSFFSYDSIDSGLEILRNIKFAYPNKIIIIGGQGIRTIHENVSFGEFCLSQDLVTYYVYGEGEQAFLNIITDNLPSVGVNNTVNNQIEDLNSWPYPIFDNYDLTKYTSSNNDILSLEGSRACVRNCSFCDIKSLFNKFRYKTGEKIFNELVYLSDKYNIHEFWFNDSLINGSMKQFRILCELLAKYNNNTDNKIIFSGQYIIRSSRQNPESDFKLMYDAGFKTLVVGLESYSESVRNHMNKKFSNTDVDYFLHMCKKYKLYTYLLMIVGYVTETEKDHQKNCQFFEKYSDYSGTVIGSVELGDTLGFSPHSPLWSQIDKLGVKFIDNDRDLWYTNNLSVKRRIERRIELEYQAIKFGFDTYTDSISKIQMTEIYKKVNNCE